MQRPLVLYHSNCNDGFCSAWLFRRLVDPEAEFKPVQYTQPAPNVKGRDVTILDFSYKRPVLEGMARDAMSMLVLDHHKTAESALAGLDYCKIRTDHSAARMTWNEFSTDGDGPIPWIVEYVEDRDLWRWSLPNSREINDALHSYPRRFEVWDDLYERGPDELIPEGVAILRYKRHVVQQHLRHVAYTTIEGHRIPVVNATVLASEIGHQLGAGSAFSASYFVRDDGKFVYSLRSHGGRHGVDVSEVARRMGQVMSGKAGGGHRNAAGFVSNEMLPLEDE